MFFPFLVLFFSLLLDCLHSFKISAKWCEISWTQILIFMGIVLPPFRKSWIVTVIEWDRDRLGSWSRLCGGGFRWGNLMGTNLKILRFFWGTICGVILWKKWDNWLNRGGLTFWLVALHLGSYLLLYSTLPMCSNP